MRKLGKTLWTLMLIAGLLPWWGMMATPVAAGDQPLRLSQVYGGGGNSGATYTHDFIELFNAGATAVDLSGWSVQYASSTGSTWQVTPLSGSIAPGGYYLIQEAQGAGGTTPLPTPDATGTIAMGGTNGKVALVNSTTALSGACPTGLIDLVGYGSANCYEGSGAAPALSSTTAALRADNGCTDADNNAADFTAVAPTPRNSASPTHLCGVASPALAINKAAAPTVGLAASDLVTYTVILANSGTLSDTHVLLTDTLPTEVDFAYWVEQPAGAAVNADELTWSGTVENGASITLTFAVTNLAGVNTTVVNTAEFSGTTQAGSDAAQYTTPFTLPYTQDFSACPATGWLIYSVASNRDWTCGSGTMSANGFGGDVASDDWLISPAFDFTSTALETLAFRTWTDYTDGGAPWPQLSVKYSTDYSGSGDPTMATWTDLTGVTFAPEDSSQWTASGELDVSGLGGGPVYFAFRYVSSGTGGSTSSSWRVDDFTLYERPPLSIAKTADPTVVVAGEVVTYTVLLNNADNVAIPGVTVTDTLPTEVDFAYWVEQPAGATVSADELTWSGTVAQSASITFTFAVTNQVNSGTVVNTAEFSSTEQTGADDASFTVMSITAIHEIQGDGATSPLLNESHTIEGIVVGDFQPAGEYIRGFFVQEEAADADADPLTSEGLFVYYNAVDVNVGDLVRVSGTVQEYNAMTQLGNITDVSIGSSGNPLPPATEISLPFSETTYLERYEGMRVSVPQTLYVTEIYKLGRGGELLLSADARLMIPTQVITPGTPATDLQDANNLNKLILDDGSLKQNPDPILYPSPYLSATNTVRGGDTVSNVVGVLSYSWSGWSGTDAYRIHPTETPTITPANPRPTSAPDVGGTVRVASFNVLNYFDTFSGCTEGVGGAATDCRGANSAEEFTRQRDKIIAAMLMLDADVIGLMEIENDGYADEASAIDDLVDGLNVIAGAGTYAYVDADARTGNVNVLGTDAIKVGMLYKPAKVILTGATAVLDSSVDPTFLDDRNRPALAQAFEDPATGQSFTVIVNHLKSKGSACDGDPDIGDGQGNCNLTREAAAQALVNWLNSDPTGVGSAHALIIGDLNSYAREDPIVALEDGGYTNLAAHMAGADMVYSYVFDGQWGTLDYAMASSSLLPYVTDTKSWHINADEPIVLDYNVEFKTPGQLSSLYSADPYRASDHDPIVVGLDLCIPVTEASIAGPLSASGPLYTGTLYSFAALITPTNATLPITYTWDPVPQTGQGTAAVSYLWATPGSKQITLTVENCAVSLTVTRALTIAALPAIQPVIITEFLPDPAAVGDMAGEWIELYNPNAEAIDLQGWILSDLGTEDHTIAASVILPAGGYLVLGRNADPALNGGVIVAYQYSGFTLGNTDDEIILTDALGREVDRVAYIFGVNGWPTAAQIVGRALQLCNPTADNNQGSAWSRATGQWTPPTGDYGSPGLPNVCGILAIHKSVTPQTAVPLGSAITYTVRVTNTGGDAVDVTIADLLPLGVDGEDLNWTGAITANTTAIFTLPAVVTTSEAFYGMTLVNTAGYVYFTQTDAATATLTLATAPQLTLTKTVTLDGVVLPGKSVTYTLTLTNSGGSPATGISLTDTLPLDLDFGGWIAQNGASVSNDTLTWNGNLSSSAIHTVVFTATLHNDPALYGQTITNTVQATASNAAAVAATAAFNVASLPPNPVIQFTKTVATNGVPQPGDSVVYTLAIANLGANAYGVLLTDTLPDEMDFGGWIMQSGASVNNDLLTWSGNLATGATREIVFTATLHNDPALYGQTITNTAYFDGSYVAGSDSAAVQVAAAPLPVIITEFLPDPSAVGDTAGEWIELYNPNAEAIDLQGWTLSDLGGEAHILTRTVILPAGGYLVLGRNADPAANGGVIVAYQYSGFTLGNTDDEIILTDALGREVDRVVYTSNANGWPTVTAGRALQLCNPATDNNVGSAWSRAAGQWTPPTGDYGSPGLPNVCGILAIHKSVTPQTAVTLGSAITYTIRVTNTGGDAVDVTIADLLPLGVDGEDLNWTGVITANTSVVFTLPAVVTTSEAFYGMTLVNTAGYVYFTQTDAATATVTLATAAQLTLEKTVTPESGVFPGDEVTYTLTLHNAGDMAATGIALTDALPWEMNFVAWIVQDTAGVTDDVITWNGDLEGGADVVISFRAAVRSDSFFIVHPVINTATYTADAIPGGSDSATFILGGVVIPTLSKTGATPDPVYPGDTVTYTLILSNPVGIAGGVILTDALPTEVDFGGWIAQNGATVSDDVITWSGDLASGASLVISFRATLHADPTLYGQLITNTAAFIADNALPGADEATFIVAPQPQEPALNLTKTVLTNGDPLPGDSVAYTLLLTNLGGGDAVGVALTDTLPPELDFGGWIAQNGATVLADVITWGGTLAGGASQTIVFTATLHADPALYEQTITNTVTATAANAEGVSDQVAFTVGAQPQTPLLTLAKAVQTEGDPLPGDSVIYTLTLANLGGAEATGVVLTDALPLALDFDGWIAQNGATVLADVITWGGTLAGGASQTIVFTATLHADPALYEQTITNTVTATAANAEGVSDQVAFTVGAQPQTPLLHLAKAVQTEGDPLPGDSVVYTLTLANLGGADAAGVVLTDALPLALDFDGWIAQNGATVLADVITWSGTLAADASQTIVFTATLHTGAALEGQTITNTVTATAANADSASAHIAFTVGTGGAGAITITKNVEAAAMVDAGGVVTYTLTLSNSGDAPATGLLLTDALPTEVDFGDWIADNGAGVTADVITWNGELGAGETLAIRFTAVVRSDVTRDGHTVTNTARFTWGATGGEASADFTLRELARIFLPLVARNF